jgi:hypothetical protein
MYKKDVYIYPDILYILIAEYEKQQRETMKHIGESIQYIHVYGQIYGRETNVANTICVVLTVHMCTYTPYSMIHLFSNMLK